MKTILFLILTFALSSHSFASTAKFDSSLKTPTLLSNLQTPPAEVSALEKLLNQRDWNQFYYAAGNLYKNCGRHDEAIMTNDQLAKELWIFYYIAVVPVGNQNLSNPNEEAPAFVEYEKDLDLKFRAFNSLVYLYHPHTSQELKARKRDVDALISSYCATYLRQMRAAVNNGFSDKFPTEADVFGEKYIRGQFEARQSYSNMYILAQNRQITAKSNVENMENRFVTSLVENFPGQKADVLKYLRMAGYEDSEIDALIDRTVGRDSKTEFLYKGRSKKDKR